MTAFVFKVPERSLQDDLYPFFLEDSDTVLEKTNHIIITLTADEKRR